jgi:ATP/maltotriose-dependent transcriptional regulator MalT
VFLAVAALWFSGCAEEAQHAIDDVLGDARKRGAALAFAEASTLRALILYTRGRVREAEAEAQTAIAGKEHGWHTWGPTPNSVLIHCLIERGDLEEAEIALRAAEQALAPSDTGFINTSFFAARGRLRLLLGDKEGALEDLLTGREMLHIHGATSLAMAPALINAGLAARAVGDHERARRLIEEDVMATRAFGVAPTLAMALRARAVLEDQPERVATLTEAVDLLEDADAPLELARALFDLGSARRRAGQREACREPLRRALDLAHQCGATELERHAHDELLSSGARPRRPVISGVDALTPSERRIAELAARGQDNREIAETLFLTRNTVAWHLRHVYRKLDVRSRGDLLARMGKAEDARRGA